LVQRDIQDWRITFVDTGANSNIGQRLRSVEKYLGRDDVFLANYSDGVTNFPLPRLIEYFHTKGKMAALLSVKPNLSCHFVSAQSEGLVTDIRDVHRSNLRINGGYYVFRRDIFKYIGEREELVQEPFQRLIEQQELLAFDYDGFFACLDTFKDKQYLDDLDASGDAPWEVWKHGQMMSEIEESSRSMTNNA